ncbi:MAG: nucleotidyltransferase [Acidobacteria bacterium]|nr:nucleotidyltransferase [Acidobacteriota bacterium]
MLNPDYKEMLSTLSDERAEFIVVGAYALAVYGFPRATGDIDIWIRRSSDNAQRVWRALLKYGVPLLGLTKEDLTTAGIVFQIGLAPRRIDILTSIDGVEFDEAKSQCKIVEIEGVKIPIISRNHLIQNKKATNRLQDVADVAWLENETQ